MAAFHLFIEGVATTPGTDPAQVAAAVAGRFALDPSDISRRLAAGRFRVKANVDYATACSFRIELEQLGVRCAIVDAATNAIVSAPPPPASMKAGKPAPPIAPPTIAPAPSAAPAGAPRSAAPLSPTPTGQYQSGLAAAFGTGNMGVGDEALGALATGAFRLTALDKNNDAGARDSDNDNDDDDVTTFASPPSTPRTAPPPDESPSLHLLVPPPHASSPLPQAAAAAPPPNQNAAFAPPSEHGEGAEPALTLLVDVRAEKMQAAEDSAQRARSQVMAVAIPQDLSTTARPASTATKPPADDLARKAMVSALAPNPRWAIGVLFATLLGFAVAHSYAGGKERAASAAVDARIMQRQAAVVTPTEWDELDAYRATELTAKTTAHRQIAQRAGVVWLLISLAFIAAWQLAVPWSRVIHFVTNRSERKP